MSEELIRKIRHWLQAGIDVLDTLNKELDQRTPDKLPYQHDIDITKMYAAMGELQREAREALNAEQALHDAPVERPQEARIITFPGGQSQEE